MRYRAVILIIVLSVIVIFTAVYFKSNTTDNVDVVNNFSSAPEFNLPDSLGNNITLSEVGGEIKVVNFWASWSPYSADELSALVRLKNEYGDRLAIVALNRDVISEEGKAFLESLDLGSSLIFVYDKNDEYFNKVDGYAMPETLFLNKDGDILIHKHGPMSYDEMNKQVKLLFNQK